MDGRINTIGIITGSLSSPVTISGELLIPTYVDVDIYDGIYTVSPDFVGHTLQTANKMLTQNVVVESIRVETVSNLSGGNTVYIGGII